MILQCMTPSVHDGRYYNIEKVAGPFNNEMQARRVAKAWSGNEDSEIDTIDCKTRKRISTKVFTQEVQQKKIKNTITTSSTSSNLPNSLDLPSFPTPPPPSSITSESQATSSKEQNTSYASQIYTTTIRPNTIAITDHTMPPMMGSPQHDVSTNQSTLDVSSPKSAKSLLTDILLSPQLSPDMPSSSQLFSVSSSQSLSDVESTQSLQEVVNSNIQPMDSYSRGVSTDVLFNGNNTDNNEQDLLEFLSSAKSSDYILEPSNDQEQNVMIGVDSMSRDCCCKNVEAVKQLIIKQADQCKKRDQQLMSQIFTINGSNTRICAALQQIDKKLNSIMTADSRLRALAIPIPTIPSPFFDLIPVKCEDDLSTVETLINSNDINELGKNKEDLKSYIYLKVGRLPLSAAIRNAIDLCFEKNILYHYSYHGKTKKKFSSLGLYQIIYDALSGLRTTIEDENTFKKVIDNYLRHSKPKE